MRKRFWAVFGALALGGLAFVAVPGTAHASNPVPYPSALSNHPYATGWTGAQLNTSFVKNASNSPGNCTNPDTGEITVNGNNVQLSTTGATGDCLYLQSPHTYPTVDGYVYEIYAYFSNWTQWDSFWMYGNNWPQDGEIDAVEGGPGVNYLSYHYEGPNGPTAYSTCNDTNGCDGNATPIQVGPNGSDISPGWHHIDISYGGHGAGQGEICAWYDGSEYGCVYGSNVLDGGSGNDPYWIVLDTGSCASANNGNVCGSSGQTSGNIQVAYLRIFT